MPSNSLLFEPIQVGNITLKNRVIMAPMTRSRSLQPGDIPYDLNALYYQQRANAGLIIAEATQVSRQGQGYAYTPGVYTQVQVEGWQKVTSAVHNTGGKIALQLWHVGRMSHRSLQQDNAQPIAPSAIKANAKTFVSDGNGGGYMTDTDAPRAMLKEDIIDVIKQFAQGAENAMKAGFDLVEVHGGNGYLFEQFQSTNTNHRTDQYGGSVENRARFLLETVDELVNVVGANRIGVRLSPWSTISDIHDEEPEAMVLYLADELMKRNIAYLHIAEWAWAGVGGAYPERFREKLRKAFANTLILCGGYTAESATSMLDAKLADAIAFGRPFIANPDFVKRIQESAPLAEPKPEFFYGGAAEGYTDYPTL
ncbi:alkene reductase [Acinetobacter sp. 3657]|uniref:alkene reductase n=1 Tax=Acinetobacter sp. 3657 TaxID=2817764 RepID=UPI0028593E71|nr:N-ethylmaleimide reductase [Prolinoborus sp. 3657]